MIHTYYIFARPKQPLALILLLGDLAYAPLDPMIDAGPLEWYTNEWGCYGIDALFGPILDDPLNATFPTALNQRTKWCTRVLENTLLDGDSSARTG